MSAAKRKSVTPPKLRAKEFDALNIVAWRHGILLLRQGGSYSAIHKPDLHTLQRDNVSPKVAVAAASRLFSTTSGPKLRHWLADWIAEQQQEAKP
jgi:hypothetical protein